MGSQFISCKNMYCFDIKNNEEIRSQFCTCHGSCAVMACANLCPDLTIIFKIFWGIFTRFELWTYKCFGKWFWALLFRRRRFMDFHPTGTYKFLHPTNEKTNGVYYASWYQGWTGSWDVYFVPALFAVEVMQDNLYQPQHKFLGWFNSLAPGRYGYKSKCLIFKENKSFIAWVFHVQLLQGEWVGPHWSWRQQAIISTNTP